MAEVITKTVVELEKLGLFWELDKDGLVTSIYVTRNDTGGSQAVPRVK